MTLTMFIMDDPTALADRGEFDVGDADQVEAEVDVLLSMLEPEFWEGEWTSSGLDTQAGRRLVVDALTQFRRNVLRKRPWSQQVGARGRRIDTGRLEDAAGGRPAWPTHCLRQLLVRARDTPGLGGCRRGR